MSQNLYIRHPEPEFDERQQIELTRLTEEENTFMTRMFVLGNASMRYYRQLEEAPTEQDFELWLEGLPVQIAANKRAKGYQACKTSIPLLRFALEMRDIGMTSYMRSVLRPEDFDFWIASSKD
jgi:hypothetical protein